MEDYRSNSHKAKESAQTTPEEPRVTKVINGNAKVRKRTGIQKFADVFIAEDVENVKSYILSDVIIPAIKDALYDAFTDGLAMMLGRDGRNRRRSGGSTTRYSYDKAYTRVNSRDSRSSSNTDSNGRLDYNSILFDERGDAERVLTELDELVSQYGIASVQDLYSAADLSCPYTYDKYGWTDLRSASVMRARDASGYYIKLPRALPIK